MKIKIIKETIFKDNRGLIWTAWEKKNKKFPNLNFIHDKFALSKKNVLRGIHWDTKTWKLISCVYGKIFFVVVNCNNKSKNYLRHKKIILKQDENISVLVPPMFGNAMLCLSKTCILHYKLSYEGKYNDYNKQFTLKWNDPKLKISWPIKKKVILSSRDK